MVCTDGDNGIYYGLKKGLTQRLIKHPDSSVSHDVITYANYLQPLSESEYTLFTCNHVIYGKNGFLQYQCNHHG